MVDPVMVATSGDLLIKRNAIAALRARLIQLATIVTPNLPEAEELTGMELRSSADIAEAARRIASKCFGLGNSPADRGYFISSSSLVQEGS